MPRDMYIPGLDDGGKLGSARENEIFDKNLCHIFLHFSQKIGQPYYPFYAKRNKR